MERFWPGFALVLLPPPSRDSEPVASSAKAITNGGDDFDTPHRNATVHIQTPSGSCSASLLTSTLAITAAHCLPHIDDTIWIGADNPKSACLGSLCPQAQAKRTVTEVVGPPLLKSIGSSMSLDKRARDVRIVRFYPPSTMEAATLRPSLLRPTLQPVPQISGLSVALFDGGFSGYGLKTILTFDPDGQPILQSFYPFHRQVAQSNAFSVYHLDVGNGFAVWIHVAEKEIQSGNPHFEKGDSGGPLFQLVPGTDQRDLLGVVSGHEWDNYSGCVGPFCVTCPGFICGEEHVRNVFADLTAPAMQTYIKGIVDPNGDGRWEGQLDYVRDVTGVAGCDVAADPSCDPGCDAVKDSDCDLVRNANDSCPDDYNPDQYNSDELSGNPYDRASSAEPGDICDICRFEADNGENCNDDVEVLKAGGPRPHFREADVVGSPTDPSESPVITQVISQYRGDACDAAPCTALAASSVELDASYGTPSPTANGCPLIALFGGHCSFFADVQVAHDGRTVPTLDGFTGSTGYRICPCAGPFLTQADRINFCFKQGPHCPQQAADFTKVAVFEPTTTPALAAIPFVSPPETGTVGDVFTFAPKTNPDSYRWLFESDLGVSLPFTDASAAAFQYDALIWSNVREHPVLTNEPNLADLTSHWLPEPLRVEPGIAGAKLQPYLIPVAGSWEQCLVCKFGFSKPWYLVSPASLSPILFAATAAGVREVSGRVDPDVLALLRAEPGNEDRRILAASEPALMLARRADPLSARIAIVDVAELTFAGAISQDASGRLLQTRGRVVHQTSAMVPCTDGDSVACGGQRSELLFAGATLSGFRNKVFVLRRGTAEPAARLHVFDLLNETWTETPLTGHVLPNVPLALTYDAHADALFAADRSNSKGNGTARLFRIRLDGRVDQLVNGLGLAHKGRVFLTTTEGGMLLLASSHDKPARFGLVVIDPFNSDKVVGRWKGSGSLVAAPFFTDRALHVLRLSKGTVDALEIDPKDVLVPGKADLDWDME